ncbi:hypothetical protein [Priestia megaterium]|uniref:hypothetical protein n=1 Tax=Priestia megaterium TaxID=1404 RepID=UPI000762939E|nr:hypothetical protein [Priestia megaterium]KWU61136.1 hypothetical protein AWX17_18660 [Priestia megaterium]
MKLTAEDIAIHLIESGIYERCQTAKKYLKMIREQFYKRLQHAESRRIEFTKHNLVAKFIPKRKFQIDHFSLNYYLYNIGLLPEVVQIKAIKDQPQLAKVLEPFQLKDEYYITPNLKLKNRLNENLPWDNPLENQSIDELAFWFNKFYYIFKQNEALYNVAKNKILCFFICDEIDKMNFKYGSFTLFKRQPVFDCTKIFNNFGAEFLIRHASASAEKIQNYILKGFLSEKDINQYRTVTDINLTFYLLPLEVEHQMLQRFQANLITASLNRIRH